MLKNEYPIFLINSQAGRVLLTDHRYIIFGLLYTSTVSVSLNFGTIVKRHEILHES